MTRSQLELLKKATYFFLVLTLGGSVMWLSSGGTIFRSDLVNVNKGTDITPQSGLLNTLKTNTNAQVAPSVIVPSGITPPVQQNTSSAATTTPAATSNPLNTNQSTPKESTYDGFASLKSSAPYTEEVSSSVVAQTYTQEVSAQIPTAKESATYVSTQEQEYAPQVLTQTKATAPESGPAEAFLIVTAFGLSLLILQIKKQRN